MKIRKTANQKNVEINKWNYSDHELREMLVAHEIFFMRNNHTSLEDLFCYDWEEVEDDTMFRIFTDELTEIKVTCPDGYYTVVATGKNGKEYFVTL